MKKVLFVVEQQRHLLSGGRTIRFLKHLPSISLLSLPHIEKTLLAMHF